MASQTDDENGINPLAELGAGDALPNDKEMIEYVKHLIERNEKALKKVNSMNAKIMLQRDISLKRLNEFVQNSINKLSSVYELIVSEMDDALRFRQREFAEAANTAVDRHVKLDHVRTKLTNKSPAVVSELSPLQDDLSMAEHQVESLTYYDLVLSPSLAGCFDILAKEKKPMYVRSSPLYPTHVELYLTPELKMTTTAKVLTTIAVPHYVERRLPTLMTGTLEKVIPPTEGTAAAVASAGQENEIHQEKILAVVTPAHDARDGTAQLAFYLDADENGDVGGDYIVRAYVYGRPINGSPLRVRVNPHSDTAEMLPSQPEDDESRDIFRDSGPMPQFPPARSDLHTPVVTNGTASVVRQNAQGITQEVRIPRMDDPLSTNSTVREVMPENREPTVAQPMPIPAAMVHPSSMAARQPDTPNRPATHLRFCGAGRGIRRASHATVSPPGGGSIVDGGSVGGGDVQMANQNKDRFNVLRRMDDQFDIDVATAPKAVPEKPFPVTPEDENEQNSTAAASTSNLRLPSSESLLASMGVQPGSVREEILRSMMPGAGGIHPELLKTRSKDPKVMATVKWLEDSSKATLPMAQIQVDPITGERFEVQRSNGPTPSAQPRPPVEANPAASRHQENEEEDWTAAASSRGLYDDDAMSVIEGSRSRYPSQSGQPIGILDPDIPQRYSNFVSSSTRPDLSELLVGNGPRYINAQCVLAFGQYNKNEPVDPYLHFPIGCTKNDVTGDYIICDTGHHVVKIFDSNARLKLMSPHESFHRPAAAVMLADNMFAIRDDKCIRIFDKDLNVIRSIGENMSGRCYGLSTNIDGNLVTLELGRGNANSYICSFDTGSGRLVDRMLFTSHAGKPKSKCRFTDCLNDRLYISDLGASAIYCVLLGTSTQLFEFGGFGGKNVTGKFNEPSGITIDKNGYLFIGDSKNDRIMYFTPDGSYMGTVNFDRVIKRPSGIHLTADGHLMVMNYLNHYVTMYKLSKGTAPPVN